MVYLLMLKGEVVVIAETCHKLREFCHHEFPPTEFDVHWIGESMCIVDYKRKIGESEVVNFREFTVVTRYVFR